MKGVVFAAIVAPALILGALAAAVLGARTLPRFGEVRGNDGVTAWRLDNLTGRISVCGSAPTGPALAQAESQLATHRRTAGGNRAALAALQPEIDTLDTLWTLFLAHAVRPAQTLKANADARTGRAQARR